MEVPFIIHVLVIVTVLCFVSVVTAQTMEDIQKLLADKKVSYNKALRPVNKPNSTVYVGLQFEMVFLKEFDEVSGKFSVVGFLIMGWYDEFLAWDPDKYAGLKLFKVEAGDFWRPPLVLINAYDKVDTMGKSWDIMTYHKDGVVSYAPGDIFESSCIVDVTLYPYDRQTCSLVFLPWGYDAKEVTLVPIINVTGTSFYTASGSWDVVDTKATDFDSGGSSHIAFEITLKRKPRFVVVNVILPIVFMSFLNMIVFIIPTESGERISYCLTTLLAIAVFLTLVGENLPKTSDPMSILSYYLLAVLVISVNIIVATVVSLRVYFRDEENPVPACLAALVRCMRCKCRGTGTRYRRRRRSYSDMHSQNGINSQNGMHSAGTDKQTNGDVFVTGEYTIYPRSTGRSRGSPYDYISVRHSTSGKDSSRSSRRRSRSASDAGEKVSWKDVSCALDIVFFISFVCVLIVATVLLFYSIMK